MNKLHLYPQDTQHDDGWLVGDRESLTALRDAITRVLDAGLPATSIHTFCEDGEGYTLLVVLQQDPEVWKRLYLPYAHLDAQHDRAVHPWSEIDDDLYTTLVRGSRGGRDPS